MAPGNNQANNQTDYVTEALKNVKSYFGYATLFSASINVLLLTPIIYMLTIFNRVISSGSVPTLVMLSLMMVALLLATGGFEWVRSRILVAANVRLEDSLRETVSKASFKTSLLTGNPQASSQAMNDLIGLRQFVTGNGIFAFMDAPWAPIYIGVMFLFHPLFGISAIVAVIVMIALAVTTEKMTGKILGEANTLAAKANMSFQSNLRNAEVIEAMGMASSIRSKIEGLYDEVSSKQAIASDKAGLLRAISKSFRMISQSTLLGLGAFLALNGEISPGLMIAGSLLLGRALAPIDIMVASWRGFVVAKDQYFRLRDGLATFPFDPDRLSLPAPLGNLSVEQVVVIPPGAQIAAVKGVNFQVNAGEILGIIGPSAAGKTSLARAILGVWPLRAGCVRLDGADIAQWNRDELGPHIGYLPQDIELFDGSIADNICRFSEQNSEKIVAASQLAGIHNMILKLPQGYDTVIGSQSGILSAGQRQRVGLARALYGEPRLIVLDEPNSNLDDQGEKELLESLQKIKTNGSTVILITHRTSILSLVDKLLLLREGEARMFGARDEVLQAIQGAQSKVSQIAKQG